MAFCIITNGSNTNHLFASIEEGITNSLFLIDRDYKYIDLQEFDFRKCIRDKCIDLETDVYSTFGCKNSEECIKKHNKEITEKIYISLRECENIVFLLDMSHGRDTLFKFHILADGLRTKFHKEGLLYQKKALYVVIDEDCRYITRSMVDDLIRKFNIECFDSFFVNKRNICYMLDVFEVAMSSLQKHM